MAGYDDGNWHAATLGHFIGLLVDEGHDPAVIFREVGRTNSEPDGTFVQRIEVLMVPDGAVQTLIIETGADIHKTLMELIVAGVVK